MFHNLELQKKYKKYKNQADGKLESSSRSGRPRILKQAGMRLIKRQVLQNPRITPYELITNIGMEGKIAKRTVRHALCKELKLKSYKPVKKPLLSAKNIRDRIAFCKHSQHWTVEQWKKVLFSDETLIKQFQTAKSYVRRPSGCRYESKYTVSTVKNSSSVMVWGAISGQGRGGLWIMPKNSTITGQMYLSILQEKLPPFMHILDCDYFQQDGASVHTCKLVT